MEKIIELKSNGFRNLIFGTILVLSPLSILWTGVDTKMIIPLMIVIPILGFVWLSGLFTVSPNQTKVLLLFGDYRGTVINNGFFWLNPFYSRKRVSLRVRNLETDVIKVNDEQGNPILISSVVVWKVVDTYKAMFDIEAEREYDMNTGAKRENREEAYQLFVKIQTESALRSIAHAYPYDNVDDKSKTITLRSGVDRINRELEKKIHDRLSIAGIEVHEARISSLSYAPEIAAIMLQVQQAQAVIGARKKIVEGSVEIVHTALEEIESRMDISADQKASMISNLLVVLCSENGTSQVMTVD